ncbi:MAG: NAD-dependent epimerase/dehydratase family protein [Rhodococcus sp. (in: high G+C Gram-positive bacteria)]|uniref:NAD-dependent epimerase/dehydratase family protein n=1 Tax=Rhodococcus sp. AB351 TaxID=3413280 RepID=UPI003C255422
MRALVTGAAGFIGSTLVDRLLSEGHQVAGVDNLHSGDAANLDLARGGEAARSGRFTLVRIDIGNPDFVDVVAGFNPDVVFHLAAQVDLRRSVVDPLFDARTNVLGTINVCEASRRAGVRRIVYASSAESWYGTPHHLQEEECSSPAPRSPYAAAKRAGEFYLGAYADMYGLTPISLALADVYGPRQDPRGRPGAIAFVGGALADGRPTEAGGDGTAVRDYVYVDDVVDAFVRAGQAPVSLTGSYVIASGRSTTIAEVHRLLAFSPQIPDPSGFAEPFADDPHLPSSDIGRARRDLGWAPVVDLVEGIRRTAQWLRALPEPVSPADPVVGCPVGEEARSAS